MLSRAANSAGPPASSPPRATVAIITSRCSSFSRAAASAGGTVIGETNDRGGKGPGAFTTEPGWYRDRDIRPEDIEATIYSALGIDWTTIRYDDPLDRGFYYVPLAKEDAYAPVDELWG